MDKIIIYKDNVNESITKKKNNTNIKKSKTLNSIIFILNNNLYCYNINNYKKFNFLYDEIYSNDIFHLTIKNNIITIIDEYLIIKKYYFFFHIIEIIIKNNYIILHGENNNILINRNNVFFLDNFEVIELYQYTLIFNSDNSYIIDEFGNLIKKKLCNNKINLFYNIIKNVGNIDKFINLVIYP